jgi:hypothetical protein
VGSIHQAACAAAKELWESTKDHQLVVWLDNWYRRRYGTDPQGDMSLNVSALAVLHITEIPVFPGHLSLRSLVDAVPQRVAALLRAYGRMHAGVAAVNAEPLQPAWLRVPLDVHRTGMRSLQWLPYQLTEYTVSSQADLLQILHDLHELQSHTQRVLPLLVDMDIHYRLMKLVYGQSLVNFDYGHTLSMIPVLYGVCTGPHCPFHMSQLLVHHFAACKCTLLQ